MATKTSNNDAMEMICENCNWRGMDTDLTTTHYSEYPGARAWPEHHCPKCGKSAYLDEAPVDRKVEYS